MKNYKYKKKHEDILKKNHRNIKIWNLFYLKITII